MYSDTTLAEEIKTGITSEAQNLFELLVMFFSKDPVGAISKIKDILNESKSISDALFWNNFVHFLENGSFDYDKLRKLSSRLEENGDNRGSAVKIVQAINKVDEPIKAKYIAKLTQSLINDNIDRVQYFRLVQVVNRLIGNDLEYIANNVEAVKFNLADEEYVDDFISCGIIMSVDGGFAYTKRAYDLVEYGIRSGHSLRRPTSLPERQIMDFVDYGDIDELFKE